MILNEILIANAQRFPNRIASSMIIGFRNVTLTYEQTYFLAQKVATLLAQNNIVKGDPVLICAPNSPFWTCVMWGCLLRGAVMVPLNIQSTSDIIVAIIKQTNAKLIFDYRGFKYNFPNLKHYQIDLLDEILENLTINFTPEKIDASDLVEIMYTSGTTGSPKGVMLTHQNISSNLIAIDQIINPDKDRDRLLSILPLSHIYEQTIGLLLPSLNQVSIVYTDSHSAIRKLLCEYKITKMLAVPEILQLFMNKIEASAAEKGRLKLLEKMINLSLKVNRKWFARLLFYNVHKQFGGYLETIASGGAPLSAELEKKWQAMGVTILQGYGLTETSPVITTNTYTDHKIGSVGKTLNNVKIKLDEQHQIWAQGPNVFIGYYKNPTKTNEVLVDNWFNTEDMGEIDQDGYLYIKGRKKYMILTASGQNVYPEDIEAVLNNLPQVQEACVIGLHDKIHAVLLLKEVDATHNQIDPTKIIEAANNQLASYQYINSWSIWQDEDFPRTATRKVKKNEVEQVVMQAQQDQHQLPKVSYSKLIKILAQVSKNDPANITPQTKIITELNLDSLGRVEMLGAIEEELRVSIGEQELNNNTTVAQLEELIKNQKPIQEPLPLKKWPRTNLARFLRIILQTLALLFMRLFVKIKIEGQNNLANLKYPIIFMPNHLSFIDPGLLLMALPISLRKQLSFAAARDFLYEDLKVLAPITELVFNSFPIQREGDYNIKLGLEFIGKMLDQGYSVTVFPEGKISKDGSLLPLKMGTGLIATSMMATIIPVKIEGIQKIFPYNKIFPHCRGTVIVKFGEPLNFKRSDDPEFARQKIQDELAKL